jgi:hypothetical protein
MTASVFRVYDNGWLNVLCLRLIDSMLFVYDKTRLHLYNNKLA